MKGLEDPILQLALPLGISFFTFQQIGFLADAYKGEVGACSLREYVLFVSFFPYVSSGPIVNAQEMLPQYRQIGRQRLDWAKFSGGLYLFALGLSKKVLLADTFGKAVDAGYGNVAGLSGTAQAGTLSCGERCMVRCIWLLGHGSESSHGSSVRRMCMFKVERKNPTYFLQSNMCFASL